MSASAPSGLGAVKPRHVLRAVGPGLLLAAVAVGVSHLIQSTRAGAMYGMAMLVFIVIAIVTKYPAYRFAPQYTLATGVSMIEGIRRQGLWALVLFALVIPLPALVGGAAITIVTAGVAKAAFHLSASPLAVAAGLLLLTAALLILGRYHWLDIIMKALMLVLTVTTVIAAALVIPLIDWSQSGSLWPASFDMRTVLFVAALIGWMPAPLETAVMHTMWTQAKIQDTGYQPSAGESSMDFHIGYLATLFLAVCFLLLGTGVMHGRGLVFVESAGGFAAQVIALYTETLGQWSRPLIGAAALAVMYSTVLSAMDGFARIFSTTILRFGSPEHPGQPRELHSRSVLYVLCLLVICAIAMLILVFLMHSFKTLIDIATTLSFLTTPVLALLIHRAIMSADVPAAVRPGWFMWIYSVICIGALTAFAAAYLFLLFST